MNNGLYTDNAGIRAEIGVDPKDILAIPFLSFTEAIDINNSPITKTLINRVCDWTEHYTRLAQTQSITNSAECFIKLKYDVVDDPRNSCTFDNNRGIQETKNY